MKEELKILAGLPAYIVLLFIIVKMMAVVRKLIHFVS